MTAVAAAAWRHALSSVGRHADLALAGVLLLAVLVTTFAGNQVSGGGGAAEVTAAVVACGALAARRHHPLVVLLVSTVAAETYLALLHGQRGDLVLAAPLVALYTLVERTGRRRGVVLGAVVIVVLAAVHVLIKPSSWIGPENVALAALGALAIASGEAARNRRAYLAEVEERARRAEREREQEARRRLTEERLHLARELHDVVGHRLALINVQAGVAGHVLESDPARAREALGHVRQAGRDALGDLNATVGLLRADGDRQPLEPTVGFDGLDALVDEFRLAGLDVDETIEGSPAPLPPAADLTAYRVVQESLTNAHRHGAGGTVRLGLAYGDDRLRIRVENAVHPERVGSGAEGHGLVGMRERVTALGGSLVAGPDRQGGFRVLASLPLTPLVEGR
jgi:signal transduction histidine kinase